MIREMSTTERTDIDEMQFELQKYFSEIDKTHESLPYKNINDAHRYIQKMIDDVENMNGKIYVAEENNQIVGFIQGVIIEHNKGDDEIYDLSHNPSKEGWIGLLYVKTISDNEHAISVYKKNNFMCHDLEMVLKV